MRRLLVLVCVAGLVSEATYAAPVAGFSAEAVDKAIEKAIKYLWSIQEDNGGWKSENNNGYPLGASSLAAYALLESGAKVEAPRMLKALQFLNQKTHKTYSLGLRANVYLAALRQDPSYREALTADVVQIANSTADGSYNYDCNADHKSSGDNSNSQYGLLGVWAGARANLEIATKYWLLVQKHWMGCQNTDGGGGTAGTHRAGR